jgi:hypothetical protein
MRISQIPPPEFVDTATDADWVEFCERVFTSPGPPAPCIRFMDLWRRCRREDRVAQFIVELHQTTGAPLSSALLFAIDNDKFVLTEALISTCGANLDDEGEYKRNMLWGRLCCNERIDMLRLLLTRHIPIVLAMISQTEDVNSFETTLDNALPLAVSERISFEQFAHLVREFSQLLLLPPTDPRWHYPLFINETFMGIENANAIRRFLDPRELHARFIAVAQGMHSDGVRTSSSPSATKESPFAILPPEIVTEFIAPEMWGDYIDELRPSDRRRR